MMSITFGQYLFDFVLFNLILLYAFISRNKKSTIILFWILALLFCLYAFWGGDYIGYLSEFTYSMDKSYRDPLYYYIKLISFDSYILFRFWVWGGALFFLFKTSKRLNLPSNLFFFIFTCCFLLLFSYSRASLAMCSYFLGFSFCVKPIKNKLQNSIYALMFIILSYYFHRSFLPLVIMTPMFYILNMSKRKIILMFCLIPLFTFVMKSVLSGFLNESINLGEGLDGFSSAANMMSKIDEIDLNTNARILKTIEQAGFYLSYIFCMWVLFWKTNDYSVPKYIKQIMNVVTFIILLATSLFIINTGGAYIVAYRYLFMSGIPLTIILSYIFKNKLVNRKYLYLVILFSLLSAEITLYSTLN